MRIHEVLSPKTDYDDFLAVVKQSLELQIDEVYDNIKEETRNFMNPYEDLNPILLEDYKEIVEFLNSQLQSQQPLIKKFKIKLNDMNWYFGFKLID